MRDAKHEVYNIISYTWFFPKSATAEGCNDFDVDDAVTWFNGSRFWHACACFFIRRCLYRDVIRH